MTTPLPSSEQLRDDLRFLRGAIERQQYLHRRLLPLPAAIVLALYVLLLCARRDFAPGWQSPVVDFAGYAVLRLWPSTPGLTRADVARLFVVRRAMRCGSFSPGLAWASA